MTGSFIALEIKEDIMRTVLWAKMKIMMVALTVVTLINTGFLTELRAAGTGIKVPEVCPIPKEIKSAGVWVLPAAKDCAIQVGIAATEPERYAAERLARDLKRKFKIELPVIRGNSVPAGKSVVLALGTRKGNPLVAKYTKEKNLRLDVDELGGREYADYDKPGLDGYVIETFQEGDVKIALVGGINSRAVIYGADTLFQLFRKEAGGVELIRASVRDWASIPWRGTQPTLDKEWGEGDPDHDVRIRARLNFIDTRYPMFFYVSVAKSERLKGVRPMTEEAYKEFVRSAREAHRRGLIIYAHVLAGAESKDHLAKVTAEYEKLFKLGADRMWIGYDDCGGGQDPAKTANMLMALARKHGMTGRQVAHTPPQYAVKLEGKMVTGSYGAFDGKGGHKNFISKVPGLDKALYYITRPPTERLHKLATEAGLAEGKYGWWHNWPRYQAGLLHAYYKGHSHRVDKRRVYFGLVPISLGWHKPKPEDLRKAREAIAAVFQCNITPGGGQPEYMHETLGYWSWNPESYDWGQVRQAIYSRIFGPAQAEAARAFDNKLRALEALFLHRHTFVPRCLKDPKNRPQALKLLDEMDALLKQMEVRAPVEGMLEPARLEEFYLEPIRATIRYGRAMTQLEFPEYTLSVGVKEPGLGRDVYELVKAGKMEAAEKMLAAAGDKVNKQLAKITEELAGLRQVDRYVAYWKRHFKLTYWKKKVEAERKRIKAKKK